MTTTTTPQPGTAALRLPALEAHAGAITVERVVLATDGGAASVGAMRWLAHRSRLHPLDITVQTVVQEDWVADQLEGATLEQAADDCLDASERYLARVAPSAEIRTSQTWGDPRAEFAASSAGADLLVVGSNRTRALSGLLGASFSTKIAEGARCPVVIVPKTWKPGTGAIVVGLAGDGTDDAALELAAREAETLHRELRVVHAWSWPSVLSSIPPHEEDTAVVDPRAQVLDDALALVRTAHPGLSVSGVIVEGHPATVLLREASGAELLVVGSHGWTVMDRFFIGSISRDIVSRPSCPVAVVRPFAPGRGSDEQG